MKKGLLVLVIIFKIVPITSTICYYSIENSILKINTDDGWVVAF